MHVRLLGSVELWNSQQPINLGAPRQQCVFAVLALVCGQAVPTEVLIDRVWGEQVPRNVRTVLYTYVSRLRSLLRQASAPEPGYGDGQAVLRRRAGGYALELAPEQVDLHRSRRLAAQARAAAGRPGGGRQAAALLAQACELWSGPPLAGITGDWAERMRVSLEHERLALLTERFAAALRHGEHETVIGPLAEALAAHPLAESLAGLLMVALHRAGRCAEALNVYAQLRRRLIEELGDEPGGELRRLHEQVLRRDPALDPPGGPAPGTLRAASGGCGCWTTRHARPSCGRCSPAPVAPPCW